MICSVGWGAWAGPESLQIHGYPCIVYDSFGVFVCLCVLLGKLTAFKKGVVRGVVRVLCGCCAGTFRRKCPSMLPILLMHGYYCMDTIVWILLYCQ